jgi:hypothetical protein
MAYEGIEVSGAALRGILDGFGDFRAMASKLTVQAGIGTAGPDGECQLDPDAWYPLERAVRLMAEIEKKVGRNTLFQVGVSIAQNARLPGPANSGDVAQILRRTDVGYHLNHRKDGQVMGNPATGEVLEGIGHFRAMATPGQNLVTCVCDTVYPCDMDRGLLTGLARRARQDVLVKHDNTQPCRKTGGANCTFVITWL